MEHSYKYNNSNLEEIIPFSTMPDAAAGPFGNTSRTYVQPFSTFMLIPKLPRCLVRYTVNIRENGSLQEKCLNVMSGKLKIEIEPRGVRT